MAVATAAPPPAAPRAGLARSAVLRAIDHASEAETTPIPVRSAWPGDGRLDDLATGAALGHAVGADRPIDALVPATPGAGPVEAEAGPGGQAIPSDVRTRPVPAGPLPHRAASRRSPGAVDVLVAISFCGAGAGLAAARRDSRARRRPAAIIPDVPGARPLPQSPRSV